MWPSCGLKGTWMLSYLCLLPLPEGPSHYTTLLLLSWIPSWESPPSPKQPLPCAVLAVWVTSLRVVPLTLFCSLDASI